MFMNILEWINENKVWLFSGIGVNILILVFALWKRSNYLQRKIKQRIRNYINKKRIVPGDVSIFVSETPPDGIPCKLNTPFIKSWTIRNSGSTVWKNRVMICETQSQWLEQNVRRVELPTIYPSEEFTLTVIYTPLYPGTYYSCWKMVDESGTLIFPELLGLNVTIRTL